MNLKARLEEATKLAEEAQINLLKLKAEVLEESKKNMVGKYFARDYRVAGQYKFTYYGMITEVLGENYYRLVTFNTNEEVFEINILDDQSLGRWEEISHETFILRWSEFEAKIEKLKQILKIPIKNSSGGVSLGGNAKENFIVTGGIQGDLILGNPKNKK